MNDRAKYKGRMAIYAMAGVYLLAQAYYMYKDIPTSSGTDKTLMSIFYGSVCCDRCRDGDHGSHQEL